MVRDGAERGCCYRQSGTPRARTGTKAARAVPQHASAAAAAMYIVKKKGTAALARRALNFTFVSHPFVSELEITGLYMCIAGVSNTHELNSSVPPLMISIV